MEKVIKSENEWKKLLSADEFYVCRLKGTEQPFCGLYYKNKEKGIYRCKCCNTPLFSSIHKYDSGSGWPSYFEPINDKVISYHEDLTHGMKRVEVTCSVCDAHLGHVFDDGPAPTFKRYCINSICLTFEKENE